MSYLNRTAILAGALLLAPFAAAQNLAAPDLPSAGRTAVAAAPTQDAVWRAYDISDLTGQDRADELRQALGLVEPAEVEAALALFVGVQKSATSTANAIAEAIRVHGLPAFQGNGAVRVDAAGNLLISGTPAHTAWVDSFLAIQRDSHQQVQIEAILYSVPSGSMDKLGVQRSSQTFKQGPLTKLQAGLQSVVGTETLFMPKVIVSSRQLATISMIEQIAYIKDYELLIVQPGDTEIADPVVDVVEDGVTFDLRAIPLGSGTYAIDVNLLNSDVTMPMATFEATLGSHTTPMTISLPEVKIVRLTTRMALGIEEGLVIRTPDLDKKRDYVMLLQLQELGPLPADTTPKHQR
ncbi:MAG: hypothetical protein ACI8QC_000218 [Planctomycetota bacterium]|jgi:hypothetical protein